MAILQSQRADATQLHLLFAKGKRPNRAAFRSFTARQQAGIISNSPFPQASSQPPAVWPEQQLWIELLREGLTFDLSGLGPGPQSDFPLIAHRFDLPEIPTPDTHEAMAFLPGPHLAAGGRNQPVVRAMLAMVCDLILHFDDLAAIGWGPSRSAIGRRFFESVISAWLDGGPFPALGLTAFTESPDGALESLGLAFWTGQELRIEPPLSFEKVAATRLGIRLVNQLVLAGRLDADERITGPDGMRLVLRPSADRALISVWRE